MNPDKVAEWLNESQKFIEASGKAFRTDKFSKEFAYKAFRTDKFSKEFAYFVAGYSFGVIPKLIAVARASMIYIDEINEDSDENFEAIKTRLKELLR